MEFKRLNLELASLKMDGEGRIFEGYASKFGGLDSYSDSILPGAYKATLENRERPIRMRWNHFGPVIGKWDEIYEDDTGLFVKGSLTPGHSVAEDAYASMKHGAIDGMSIGYRVKSERKEGSVRYLKEIDLIEISVVEEPADLGAKVSGVKFLREMIDACESYKEMEALLRDGGGFSRSAATQIVSRIKALSLGEQERKGIDYNHAIQILTKGK